MEEENTKEKCAPEGTHEPEELEKILEEWTGKYAEEDEQGAQGPKTNAIDREEGKKRRWRPKNTKATARGSNKRKAEATNRTAAENPRER